MYQNRVDGREVPRSLLARDFPEEDNDANQSIMDALEWDKNTDTDFKGNNYPSRLASCRTSAAALQITPA